MKSTTYTNLMLTVIALSLSLLVIQQLNIFPAVHAESSNNFPYQSILPLNEDGSLNVRLQNLDEIDVNISGISTYDELEVNIEEIKGGPVRVRVE